MPSGGFLLAVTMSNAGGAWDNAKKWVEKGNLGTDKGKRSREHMAVIVGDTVTLNNPLKPPQDNPGNPYNSKVGDPFKDTSGPSLNILIKLMSIISLMIAPLIARDPWTHWGSAAVIITLAVLMVIFLPKLAPSAGFGPEERNRIDKVAKRRNAYGLNDSQADRESQDHEEDHRIHRHHEGLGARGQEGESHQDIRDLLDDLDRETQQLELKASSSSYQNSSGESRSNPGSERNRTDHEATVANNTRTVKTTGSRDTGGRAGGHMSGEINTSISRSKTNNMKVLELSLSSSGGYRASAKNPL